MYKVGDVFYLDDEYANSASFCNENNLVINEIESDEKGRRFQIQEPQEPSGKVAILFEIAEKKQILEKYKEDVEQVELFGMKRDDYEEKKKACVELILELRELEKQLEN